MIDFGDTWCEDNSNQFVVYRDRNPSYITKLNDQLGRVLMILELHMQLFILNLQKFTILVF